MALSLPFLKSGEHTYWLLFVVDAGPYNYFLQIYRNLMATYEF